MKSICILIISLSLIQVGTSMDTLSILSPDGMIRLEIKTDHSVSFKVFIDHQLAIPTSQLDLELGDGTRMFHDAAIDSYDIKAIKSTGSGTSIVQEKESIG
jgi:hypothetical protein